MSQPEYPQQPYQPYGQQPYGYPQREADGATTALVLGILGLVLCQFIAPFAWAKGKGVLNEIDASNGALGGRGSAQAGYIMGIIGTIFLVLGILAGIVWVIFVVFMLSSSSTSTY
ncbi:DUF4190 domain-containing protein [Nocardia camponoti]|nr:DUF4190 domain-containing protein [Nocardia camponoti]